MSKSALGRGLGSLMNGDKPAVSVEPPNTSTAASEPSSLESAAGPGVSSLLRGKAKRNVFAEPPPETSPAAEKRLIPTWYYFAADVVLVLLALLLVFKQPQATWKELAFAGLLVAAGGTLAALGVLQRGKQ